MTNKMDSTRVEMDDEFDNCIDDKVCVYETIINEQLSDTDNKLRSINNYFTVKNENINDGTAVGFSYKEPCDMEYKQGSIHNYVSIKEEDIDELITDCIDDMVCLHKTETSGAYIEQELCGIKDEQSSIQDYLHIKDENLDDLTEIVQKTKLVTDCIDNKVCVDETLISGAYIKEEPCDTGNESGSVDNIINRKGCIECGEEYDLYCCNCSMLIRILDSNNPDETDNTVRQMLPKDFLDICETQSGLGIVALRAIPKGVVFGPFKGVDSIKHELVSKWKLKNKRLDVMEDTERINWMQYIRSADKSSHQNLVPIQYKDELYYRSEDHINVGDELLVGCISDSKESEISDMEDSYCVPEVCESLDDTYACTFCCVGYKSINHLKAHNSTCIKKRNKKDFCEEIVQCDICKIYLDKKEYSDYHIDRCYKSDEKCVFNLRQKRNCGQPLHNGNKFFSCTLCRFNATRKSILQRHMGVHNNAKPFASTLCPYKAKKNWSLKEHTASHSGEKSFTCTLCPYNTKTKSNLKQHIAVHNDDKPFACTLCPYKAKTSSNLRHHIAIHSGDKLFACTLCSYKATRNSDLKRHIAIHNGEKPFACTLCPYKTRRKSNLRLHMSVHNDDKPFACTFCQYKATTRPNLKQHIGIHNSEKPFACTLCPYKTTRKANLKLHMSVHNGNKPFACILCPFTATTKSNLKQHIGIHNGEKPFGCTLCPYKTTRRSYLRLHMSVHNDDKPFACTLCQYKATTNSNLKQHIVIHNNDKPFACTLCPYRTKYKSYLKKHIASHNGDKP